MEKVRKLGKRGKTGEEIVMAKIKTIEQKARVMKGKGKLAEQKERLEDDLTWEDPVQNWEGIAKGKVAGEEGEDWI